MAPIPSLNSTQEKYHELQGILAMLFAMFTYTTINAFIKAGDQIYPVPQVVFFRNFFALIPYYFLIKKARISVGVSPYASTHLWRGIIGAVGHFGLFGGLLTLPFSDANVLTFSTPFLVCILSYPLLKERITPYGWIWIIVGFIGVIMIAGPTGRVTLDGFLMIIGFTFTEALLMVHSRLFSRIERPERMTFYFGIIASIFTLLIIMLGEVFGVYKGFIMPTFKDLMALITLGIGGGIGQFCVTFSYSKARSQVVAPLIYTAMLWSLLYGIVFFHEELTKTLFLGSLFIIISGLMIVLPKRKRP